MLKYKLDEAAGILTLFLEGRVDSINSPEIEKDALEICANSKNLVIDVEKLEYISSSGLRIILKLGKLCANTSIVNASSEVYEILDATGFTDIFKVRRALQEISVEGCQVIGRGGNSTVYRLDEETIVKIYDPRYPVTVAEDEQKYARAATVYGIPTPLSFRLVKCGESFGIVFELINAKSLGRLILEHPENLDEYTSMYTKLLKTLHSARPDEGTFNKAKDVMLKKADLLDKWLEPAEVDVVRDVIRALPDDNCIIHGDFHPGNIMVQAGEPILIDMAEVSTGAPIIDLAAVYRDICSAPLNSPDTVQHNQGLTPELALALWKKFCQNYCGTDDSETIAKFEKKCSIGYVLSAALCLGIIPPGAEKHASGIRDKLIRGILIPQAEMIKMVLGG
ncbi:MAG: phosphotransferase [Eubacteriales bacterium]|nr:phosphotransferase [Eubacteriales bacterium]